jgi:hypothetical protein
MVCNCAAGGSDDMGIVNVYCGCGCGSGAGTGSDLDDGTAPGGTPIDDAMPPVDNTDDYDDGTDYDFTQQDACALVHWVLLFWRNTLLGVASGELAISSVWSLVDGMFQGLFTYSIPKPGVVDEILLWFGRLTSASTLAAEIDRTYESIQCRLLQRDIYRDKYADVCDIIDTWATSALTKLYAKRFIDILPFRWIYSSNVIGSTITNNLVPAWAYARGCPSCVQEVEVDPFPTVPTGYRWRVGTQAVYSVGGGVTATPLGNVVDASVPLAGADRFLQMRYANYNATGVFGIAVFVELMPAEMIVLSGGWFVANTTFRPSEFSKYVIWADKGAPVVDWGDWVNVPATKTLTLDLGRMNFLQGGGLYRFTCLELVPE